MIDTIKYTCRIGVEDIRTELFTRKIDLEPGQEISEVEPKAYIWQVGTLRITHDGRPLVREFAEMAWPVPEREKGAPVGEKGQKRKRLGIESGFLSIECSVPKLLLQNNVYEVCEASLIKAQEVIEGFTLPLVRVDTWKQLNPRLTRVDFCANIAMEPGAIEDISKMQYIGRSRAIVGDKPPETVYFNTSNRRSKLMFYNKMVETRQAISRLERDKRDKEAELEVLREFPVNRNGTELVRCEKKVSERQELCRLGLTDIRYVTGSMAVEELLKGLAKMQKDDCSITKVIDICGVLIESGVEFDEICKWIVWFSIRNESYKSDKAFLEDHISVKKTTFYKVKRQWESAGINVRNLGKATIDKIIEGIKQRQGIWSEKGRKYYVEEGYEIPNLPNEKLGTENEGEKE